MGFKPRANNASGFTLIEILLVIAILMGVGLMEMRRDVAKARESAAVAVGKQMALVGKAAELYMATKSASLQAMTDPNCIVAGNTCSLNVGAMIGEGYLPADFLNQVQFGGTYLIRVVRVAPPAPAQAALICGVVNPTPIGCPDQTGAIPAWQWGLQGLVYTSQPWTDSGTVINWTMLGQAAKQAGPSAGVTQGGTASGLYGGWSVPGAMYGAALADGQLTYITGSQVNLWSQFVRRDGSLPMTGNLDMGSYNVVNMRDMFINGPSTNPRNKNLSSLLPNWVFKGAYSANDGDFVPAPLCSSGGQPKIKLMMQLLQGTKSEYYNDTSGAVTAATNAAIADFVAGSITSSQAQAIIQGSLADHQAVHSMNSWAVAAAPLTGWNVFFQDRFNEDDSAGNSTAIRGSGLAELYCNYPDQ
jgi:competence protein ComGC